LGANRLQVGHEPAFGFVVGMADIIANLGFFAANGTHRGHGILLKKVEFSAPKGLLGSAKKGAFTQLRSGWQANFLDKEKTPLVQASLRGGL